MSDTLNCEERAKLGRLCFMETKKRHAQDLALGFLRYEAIRKLTVEEFKALVLKNLAGVAAFDNMVDELILRNKP